MKVKLNKNVIKMYIILLLILIITLMLILKIATKTIDNKDTENEIYIDENLNVSSLYNGFANKDNEWIYYIVSGNENEKDKICRVNILNKKIEEIYVCDTFENVSSLNLYNDYIYFISTQINDNIENINICKIKKDGSNFSKISNNIDCNFEKIYLINNSIYYSGYCSNFGKIDLDGSNNVTIIENQTDYLGINNKYIVYEDDYEIKISSLDKTIEKTLFEKDILTDVFDINIVDDDIYYINEEFSICKMNINTLKVDVISKNDYAENLVIQNDNIYYISEELHDSEVKEQADIYLNKLNIKNNTIEKITKLKSKSDYVIGLDSYIIYTQEEDKKFDIILLNIDNSDNMKLATYDISEQDEMFDDDIFIEDDNNEISDEEMKMTNQELENFEEAYYDDSFFENLNNNE